MFRQTPPCASRRSKRSTAGCRAIEAQLSFAPGERTRNRKPLEELPGPFDSSWELRCGPANRFRVFYEIARSTRQVWVLAIGVKDRDRLFIAGEEFDP